MDESMNKYILLVDRVGYTRERNFLALGLSKKASPTQVLRGELLEALPEAEQPSDGNRIALVSIERKSLRLECPTVDVILLSDEEANLLLAISSLGERDSTAIDRERMDFGRRLSPGNQVFVSVKGFSGDLPGIVWYKGELPSCPGTMFGVELITFDWLEFCHLIGFYCLDGPGFSECTKHPGQGTCDGAFRNKRYFTCPSGSGVFVGLDKLTPREVSDSKSPKKDENAQANLKSRLMDTVVPSFLKGKNEGKSPQGKINQPLEIDQRVVTFIKDYPVRGTVRYIGQEEDASGNMHTIVGLELDERVGSGRGKRNGQLLFVCKRDFACFVDIGNVIREEDFDENPKETEGIEDTQIAVDIPHGLEVGSMVEVLMSDGLPRYGVIRWIGILPQLKDKLVAGLELEEEQSPCSDGTFGGERYFTCPLGRGFFTLLEHCRQDSRFDSNTPTTDASKERGGSSAGKTHRTSSFNSNDDIKVVESNQTDPTTFVERQRQPWVPFSEEDQQDENSQTQLSDMEQRVKRMQEQLRQKEDELEISERLREQQLTNFHEQQRHLHEQLREKDQQEENLQRQLREIQEELREKDQHKEIVQRQLGEIQEQLREKDQQEENLQRQSREIQEQLREKDQQEENLQRQLEEIQEELREKDQQEENLQRQLEEIQEQLREKDQQEKSAQRQVTALERQLRVKDQQVNELRITLSTAQQALSEHQRRQVTPDWVISRDQIQLTDKLLGRGGWGSVVEGKYCGCSVAVKQIHELILSPHNRTLFEREMDVASRCRHPCLLQFVGATNEEGSPLFVTELMESSLRALLGQRPLAATQVSTISLDVARALNYLHQKKPSPIIHRDISSANVLLWRQGDQWRGKVSDYGTANFMQHTMTVGPGAAIYMAPEALTSNQTVKVDVYSFGVLLCEMCIRELPDPERRDQQIAMVKDHLLRALIRGCLQSDPEARPNMEEIIEELEEPV